MLICRSLMTSVYESLFTRLQDNVPTVREAAAIALGCVVSTHGNYTINASFYDKLYNSFCLDSLLRSFLLLKKVYHQNVWNGESADF